MTRPATRSAGPRVPWCDGLPPRPRCDVPWIGSVNVLSDGVVNFCCFSDAVIGNVNEQPFEAMWNGATMQRVRAELGAGRLPQECRNPSCPIFRGDDPSVIQMRMDGPFDPRRSGIADPHAALRARITRAVLGLEPERLVRGRRFELRLELAVDADELGFDLYAAARDPTGSFQFLPDFGDVPLPVVAGASIARGAPRSIVLCAGDVAVPPGRHELAVALFVPDTNPMIASNCIHSLERDFTVE